MSIDGRHNARANGIVRTAKDVFLASLAPGLRVALHVWSKGGPSFRLQACLKALSVSRNVRGHLELLRVLARPHTIDLMHRHPRLAYRYLNPCIALGFDRQTRLKAIINHYEYLGGRVHDGFLPRVFDESPAVWQERLDELLVSIHLSFPKEHDCEGDLRLDFRCDGEPLYTMTFTIVPGQFVEANASQALLITAIQGAANKIELLKKATKSCHDTAPPHLLFAAVQGVARSLRIDTLIGISSGQQISREDTVNAGTPFDYDNFWKTLIGEEQDRDFYAIPVPLPEKPIEQFRSNRRARVLRRRQLRSQIQDRVLAHFMQNA